MKEFANDLVRQAMAAKGGAVSDSDNGANPFLPRKRLNPSRQ